MFIMEKKTNFDPAKTLIFDPLRQKSGSALVFSI
jgi:hypothetical protein